MIVKHSHAIFERTVSIILVGLTVYVRMVILDLVSGVEVCKRSGIFFYQTCSNLERCTIWSIQTGKNFCWMSNNSN